jgi:uncharacterized protein YjiS (DUF1127 family)
MHSVPANPDRTRSGAAGGFQRRTAKGFAAVLAWWQHCRSRAAERRALAALSDWGLRDIGLTRAEADGGGLPTSRHNP